MCPQTVWPRTVLSVSCPQMFMTLFTLDLFCPWVDFLILWPCTQSRYRSGSSVIDFDLDFFGRLVLRLFWPQTGLTLDICDLVLRTWPTLWPCPWPTVLNLTSLILTWLWPWPFGIWSIWRHCPYIPHTIPLTSINTARWEQNNNSTCLTS